MNYDFHTNGMIAFCGGRLFASLNRRFNQIITTMKLTALLILIFAVQLTAKVSGQTISLFLKNAPFAKAIEEIGKQSNYDFSYSKEVLKMAKPVSVTLRNTPLETVLKEIFAKQPLTYEIADKIIIIKEKGLKPAPAGEKKTQLNISGKVIDESGNALQNVTVSVKETGRDTFTDAAGRYTLSGVPERTTLQFRLLGYNPLEVPADKSTINVIMASAVGQLSEVSINAGYWKVSDKLRTGNISVITGEALRQQPLIDPMLALSGRIAGMQVIQSSGLPGSNPTVRIRGQNSIANSNNPLYIIDGIPYSSNPLTGGVIPPGAAALSPFALLNATEIESIEVLKDADATAIYGSRGANGVILITTRKGKSGKAQINLDAYAGFGQVTRKLDLLNTRQYLDMRREAFKNDGITTYPASAYDVNGTWDQNRYTDWQDVILGNNSRISNLQAQFSGGTAQTQYMAGGGITDESTVFPGNFKTKKTSASFSLNHRSADNKLGLTFSGRYLQSNSDQPQTDFSINRIWLPPNAPAIYDAQGNLNWENNTWDNPFAQLKARAKAISKNIVANGSLDYRIVDGLIAKLKVGYNQLSLNQSIVTPITTYNPSLANVPSLRTNRFATNEIVTWIAEPQLNYSWKLGGGKFDSTLGTTFQQTAQDILTQTASNFADDALIENITAAATLRVNTNSKPLYRYAAIFARLYYNWKDRYLLNLVGRRDGSSRFGPEKKFGNFASVGAAWVFANEPALKKTFSTGKIRASYGITGNDQLTDYQYLSTYSSYNFVYLGQTGLFPTRLFNPDYGWEAVKKFELALDLGFFEDRLRISSTYYRNRTNNQLVGYTLPSMTGFSSIQANLPAIIQNSGWEFELNSINWRKKDLLWTTAFNISIPRNELISYPNLATSSYRNKYEIGKPLTVQKKLHYLGVDPQTGTVVFEDISGDNAVSSPQDLQALVNTGQRFFGGVANNLTYKDFQLDLFIQFVKQTGTVLIPGVPGTAFNQPLSVLNRWQNQGDNTAVQRFTQTGAAFNAFLTGINSSDMIYGDASFIRLKNVSLSYRLPVRKLGISWLNQCRIYIQCQNLLTITGYKGMDPETQTFLPPIRMTTAGLNFTL